jgi:starch phosphorylase
VIPLYYARDERLGYSPGWVRKCKRSMSTILPHFNMNRVVHDYAVLFYGPAAKRGRELEADGFVAARTLADWKHKARTAWPGVGLRLASEVAKRIDFSASVTLEADVVLNGLSSDDIRLECVISRQLCSSLTVPVRQFADRGGTDAGLRVIGDEHVYVQAFTASGDPRDGVQRYQVALQPPWCGELNYEIRATPWHPGLSHPYELGLMRWV